MNSLSVIMIFIIILLVIYLVLRFYQNKKILESFSTQDSLSTFFQQTVDSDDYMTYNNTFNSLNQPVVNSNIIYNSNWNGVWSNQENYLYAQFIEQNDKLIIVFSNSSFNNLYSTLNNPQVDPQYEKTLEEEGNLFVGIGTLNSNKTIFNLQTVIVNGYINSTLGLGEQSNPNPSFSGTINNNFITLYSTNAQIILNLVSQYNDSNSPSSYPYLNKYIQSITPFVTSYPDVLNTEYIYEENSICPDNLETCINLGSGTGIVSYNSSLYNACCNTDNSVNCNITPFTGSPLPTCQLPSNPTVNSYINYSAASNLQNVLGSNLTICSILNNFTKNGSPYNFNSAILCYVTNLGNVQTLNYQFFGSMPEQSSLTVQYDIMNNILNNLSDNIESEEISDSMNLPYYRKSITNYNSASSNMTIINNGISMSNCIENNTVAGSPSTLTNSCVTSCQNYINSYVESKNNFKTMPTVWQINYNVNSNLTNDCPFTLSTSQYYDTPVKYVECNNNGTTSLSLYPDGNKQKIFMENANVINKIGKIIVITTNLRANNGLYLIPSNSYGGFSNNSNIVTLSASPNPNGKWFVIGFSLYNMDNLLTTINTNITF